MPKGSHRVKHTPKRRKSKERALVAPQPRPTVEETSHPRPLPIAPSPKLRSTAEHGNVSAELKRIGVISSIIVVLLIVLCLIV